MTGAETGPEHSSEPAPVDRQDDTTTVASPAAMQPQRRVPLDHLSRGTALAAGGRPIRTGSKRHTVWRTLSVHVDERAPAELFVRGRFDLMQAVADALWGGRRPSWSRSAKAWIIDRSLEDQMRAACEALLIDVADCGPLSEGR